MGIIATNALPIIEARKKGFKPDEMILVSLIGRINESNHTVYASPQKDYDWLWACGLQVCIYAAPNVKWQAIARSIASAKPSFLGLWDAERLQGTNVYLLPDCADIDKPKAEWRWKLDFLPWQPTQNQAFAWN